MVGGPCQSLTGCDRASRAGTIRVSPPTTSRGSAQASSRRPGPFPTLSPTQHSDRTREVGCALVTRRFHGFRAFRLCIIRVKAFQSCARPLAKERVPCEKQCLKFLPQTAATVAAEIDVR